MTAYVTIHRHFSNRDGALLVRSNGLHGDPNIPSLCGLSDFDLETTRRLN